MTFFVLPYENVQQATLILFLGALAFPTGSAFHH